MASQEIDSRSVRARVAAARLGEDVGDGRGSHFQDDCLGGEKDLISLPPQSRRSKLFKPLIYAIFLVAFFCLKSARPADAKNNSGSIDDAANFAGSDPPVGTGLDERIAIVQSNHTSGQVDRHRLIVILERSCAEMHIDESSVPRIVFIRISQEDASVGGVPVAAPVMVERGYLTVDGRPGQPRFLVWLVARPSDQNLVAAILHVLRLHLGLNLSDADLHGAVHRILRQLNDTVDVKSLVK